MTGSGAGSLPEVVLRPFVPTDFPLLLRWMGTADQDELIMWSGPHFTAPLDERQLWKLYDTHIETGEIRLFLISAGAGEADSHAALVPIGVISLRRVDLQYATGRVGFVLVGERKFRGRGYASAAMAEVVRIGFEEEKFHKITLGVVEGNGSALRCYNLCGFRVDGLLRDHAVVAGEYRGLIEMSLLAGERRDGTAAAACHGLPQYLYRETKRLVMRTLSERDAEAVASFYRENREFHAPWSPARDEAFCSPAGQRAILAQAAADSVRQTGLRLWLQLKENKAEVVGEDLPDSRDSDARPVIGMVSLTEIVHGPFQSAFLGCLLDRKMTGQGLMTEALRELLRIGFRELGLHRIEANVMPTNRPSVRLFERLGFRCEGRARRYLKIDGRWEDHLHYVMLSEDFEDG